MYRCCTCDSALRPGDSVLLLCNCLVTICQDCARVQLLQNDLTYNSYISCPVCSHQVPADHEIFIGVADAMSQEDAIVRQALADTGILHSDTAPPSFIKLQACMNKLMLDANPAAVKDVSEAPLAPRNGGVNRELEIVLANMRLKITHLALARADLPIHPVAAISFRRNRFLENYLVYQSANPGADVESFRASPDARQTLQCSVCISDVTVGRSVLLTCQCNVIMCKPCAVSYAAVHRDTYHEGITCSWCRQPARGVVSNLSYLESCEQELIISGQDYFTDHLLVGPTDKKIGKDRFHLETLRNMLRLYWCLGYSGDLREEQMFSLTERQVRYEIARLEEMRLNHSGYMHSYKPADFESGIYGKLPLGFLGEMDVRRNVFFEHLCLGVAEVCVPPALDETPVSFLVKIQAAVRKHKLSNRNALQKLVLTAMYLHRDAKHQSLPAPFELLEDVCQAFKTYLTNPMQKFSEHFNREFLTTVSKRVTVPVMKEIMRFMQSRGWVKQSKKTKCYKRNEKFTLYAGDIMSFRGCHRVDNTPTLAIDSGLLARAGRDFYILIEKPVEAAVIAAAGAAAGAAASAPVVPITAPPSLSADAPAPAQAHAWISEVPLEPASSSRIPAEEEHEDQVTGIYRQLLSAPAAARSPLAVPSRSAAPEFAFAHEVGAGIWGSIVTSVVGERTRYEAGPSGVTRQELQHHAQLRTQLSQQSSAVSSVPPASAPAAALAQPSAATAAPRPGQRPSSNAVPVRPAPVEDVTPPAQLLSGSATAASSVSASRPAQVTAASSASSVLTATSAASAPARASLPTSAARAPASPPVSAPAAKIPFKPRPLRPPSPACDPSTSESSSSSEAESDTASESQPTFEWKMHLPPISGRVLALASQSLPLTSAPEPATPAAASPHASPQRKVAKPAETLAGVKKAAREQQLWPDIPRQLVEERDLMQYIQYLQMICPPNPSAGEIHEDSPAALGSEHTPACSADDAAAPAPVSALAPAPSALASTGEVDAEAEELRVSAQKVTQQQSPERSKPLHPPSFYTIDPYLIASMMRKSKSESHQQGSHQLPPGMLHWGKQRIENYIIKQREQAAEENRLKRQLLAAQSSSSVAKAAPPNAAPIPAPPVNATQASVEATPALSAPATDAVAARVIIDLIGDSDDEPELTQPGQKRPLNSTSTTAASASSSASDEVREPIAKKPRNTSAGATVAAALGPAPSPIPAAVPVAMVCSARAVPSQSHGRDPAAIDISESSDSDSDADTGPRSANSSSAVLPAAKESRGESASDPNPTEYAGVPETTPTPAAKAAAPEKTAKAKTGMAKKSTAVTGDPNAALAVSVAQSQDRNAIDLSHFKDTESEGSGDDSDSSYSDGGGTDRKKRKKNTPAAKPAVSKVVKSHLLANAALNDELELLQIQHNMTLEENASLKTKPRELKAELKKSNKALKKETRKHKKTIERMTERYILLRDELEQVKTEVYVLGKSNATLKEAEAKALGEAEVARAALAQALQERDLYIGEASAVNAALQRERDLHFEETNRLERAVCELQDGARVAADARERLQRTHDATLLELQRERAATLKQSQAASALREENERLKRQQREREAAVKPSPELSALQEEIYRLRQQLRQAELATKQSQGTDALWEENERLRRQLASHSSAPSTLIQGAYQEINHENERLQAEVSKLTRERATLCTQLGMAHENLRIASTERYREGEECAGLRAEIQQQQGEIQRLQATLRAGQGLGAARGVLRG